MRALPELIKHVGRGARLARELAEDEAEQMMAALAGGDAEPVQIGAFLIAMRMKGETAGELAGFVRALRRFASLEGPPADLDVDLHGDGREGRPSVALAAACVVASFGARVLVRGWFDNPHARNDWGVGRLGAGGPVSVVDLESYAPRVAALLRLREKIGVRTCVQTAVKLLDPSGARRLVAGIFHSPYHEPVAGALVRLGVERAAVVQAPGGTPEVAPDKPTRVSFVDGASVRGPEALAPRVATAPEETDDAAGQLEAVLRGHGPPGVTAMTVATAALWRWAAGQTAAPDSHQECAAAVTDGRAAAVLAASRTC
jgi:anthranilate phosphoribosyltransferase